jgi:hypothetical protein
MSLGIYNAENGKSYDLIYFEEYNLGIAIGIPNAGAGVGSFTAEIQATSAEEARRKLEETLHKMQQGPCRT